MMAVAIVLVLVIVAGLFLAVGASERSWSSDVRRRRDFCRENDRLSS